MRISWEHDIDGLRTWADLEHHLGDAWSELTDRRTGLVLLTVYDELHLDEPPDGTASQRDALRRLGFQPRDEGCWSWTPADLTLAERTTGAYDAAVDRARSAQALRVLREVYDSAPADLRVTVFEEDGEDEWEDDDDAWPGLDCAALEARYGRPG